MYFIMEYTVGPPRGSTEPSHVVKVVVGAEREDIITLYPLSEAEFVKCFIRHEELQQQVTQRKKKNQKKKKN